MKARYIGSETYQIDLLLNTRFQWLKKGSTDNFRYDNVR